MMQRELPRQNSPWLHRNSVQNCLSLAEDQQEHPDPLKNKYHLKRDI